MERNDAPDPVGCITGALKYVKAVRQPVYERHRLASTPPTASKKGVLVAAQIERERRAEAHSLFEELSRYYQMAGGNGVRSRGEIRGGEQVWNCVALLSEGKLGLDHSSR